MTALELTDLKTITAHLFLRNTFDAFCLIEGEITTFNTFHIDGRIHPEFFDTGETAGGFRLARTSSIRDGLFDCILLEKKDFFRSTLAMGRYLLGGNPKIVRHFRARRIDIRSTVNEPTDVDGQPGAEFPLHIECMAGGLRVIVPNRADS